MQSEAALLKAVLPERRPAILNQNEAANLTSADKAVFEHVVQAAVAAVMMEGENLDKVCVNFLLCVFYNRMCGT